MSYIIYRNLARKLRSNQTEAENLVWGKLRKRQFEGLRFNRQYLIKYEDNDQELRYFIVDFYNHENRLIIEIDGEYHNLKEHKTYDEHREKILKELGFTVIRFTNFQVMKNWKFVENTIMKHV